MTVIDHEYTHIIKLITPKVTKHGTRENEVNFR